MKKTITLIALILSVFAHAQRTCGTMEYLQYQLQKDPDMAKRMQQIEVQTAQYSRNMRLNKTTLIVTIPVVVHVVYKTTAQNISDAQIQTQIDVLNKDYRKLNADTASIPAPFKGLATDIGIEFVLAKRDPSGNPTTGITRTVTTKTSFTTNDGVKAASTGGHDAWNTTKYLNLWCCNLSGGVLGYAQFPGGAASTDGVVILYSAFGSGGTAASPYNLGRTATHEVGHWLNLRHIWGDGTCADDYVSDTPTQQAANYGCPTYPHVTCSNGASGDMFMNYMDYVDDACMFMFSYGQSVRMSALFATGGARVSLLTSMGGVPIVTCGVPNNLAVSNISSNKADLTWDTIGNASSGYIIKYKLSSDTAFTTINTTYNSFSLNNLLPQQSYDVKIAANCGTTNGTSNYSNLISFTTIQTCNPPSGLSASGISTTGAKISWSAINSATLYVVQYKKASASAFNTINTSNTNYTLTNLQPGTNYVFNVSAFCTTMSSNFTSNYSFTTDPFLTCNDRFEMNDTRMAASLIRANNRITGKISSPIDVDWYRFENDSTAKNINIVLTNQPANYDIYLYNSNGNLITASTNPGLAYESITFNTTNVGSYYVKVVGAGRAFNSNNCYALKCNTSGNAFRETSPLLQEEPELTSLSFSVYPNPAHTTLYLELHSLIHGQSQVKLFDLDGREVMQSTVSGTTTSLSVEGIKPGMYLLDLQTEETHHFRRVVIE